MKETQLNFEFSNQDSLDALVTQAQQSTILKQRDSKQWKLDSMFSQIALEVSQQSHDEKHKVGCVIVKDGNIISMGWNGTPSGCDNTTRINGITKPEVVHSEANAIAKLAKNGGNSDGATLYCTHSPCWECAKLVLQSGIVRVVHRRLYDVASARWLEEQGVKVESIWGG